ncbi:MAG: tetratricopeptide repeat protein [Nitrospinae bacterium]|nr:tetratricopeptide repeat protein [Nitrospinota bacterium]
MGTNPNKKDTDGDGLNDKYEMFAGTNPLLSDTDGDGISDGEEVLRLHTNPLRADTPAKKKTAGLIPSDVESMVAVIPPGPMVEAYIAMAVEAHDRFRDLDAAHDWLERALELDPDNYVAKGILDRVKAEEQQVGLQRAGVVLGALQQMLAEQARREQEQQEHEEYKESHPGGERHPGGGERPPVEEWDPPPKEDY